MPRSKQRLLNKIANFSSRAASFQDSLLGLDKLWLSDYLQAYKSLPFALEEDYKNYNQCALSDEKKRKKFKGATYVTLTAGKFYTKIMEEQKSLNLQAIDSPETNRRIKNQVFNINKLLEIYKSGPPRDWWCDKSRLLFEHHKNKSMVLITGFMKQVLDVNEAIVNVQLGKNVSLLGLISSMRKKLDALNGVELKKEGPCSMDLANLASTASVSDIEDTNQEEKKRETDCFSPSQLKKNSPNDKDMLQTTNDIEIDITKKFKLILNQCMGIEKAWMNAYIEKFKIVPLLNPNQIRYADFIQEGFQAQKTFKELGIVSLFDIPYFSQFISDQAELLHAVLLGAKSDDSSLIVTIRNQIIKLNRIFEDSKHQLYGRGWGDEARALLNQYREMANIKKFEFLKIALHLNKTVVNKNVGNDASLLGIIASLSQKLDAPNHLNGYASNKTDEGMACILTPSKKQNVATLNNKCNISAIPQLLKDSTGAPGATQHASRPYTEINTGLEEKKQEQHAVVKPLIQNHKKRAAPAIRESVVIPVMDHIKEEVEQRNRARALQSCQEIVKLIQAFKNDYDSKESLVAPLLANETKQKLNKGFVDLNGFKALLTCSLTDTDKLLRDIKELKAGIVDNYTNAIEKAYTKAIKRREHPAPATFFTHNSFVKNKTVAAQVTPREEKKEPVNDKKRPDDFESIIFEAGSYAFLPLDTFRKNVSTTTNLEIGGPS